MLIGELARQAGLTPATIRFYEKKGLLDVQQVTRMSNNYKEYTLAALERLQFIARAKSAGFTLAETMLLVRDWDTLDTAKRLEVLRSKVQQIDCRLEELAKMKGYLDAKIAALGNCRT